MKKLALALLALLAIGASAGAQPVPIPVSNAGVYGAYNAAPPTCVDGTGCWLQTDVNGKLLVTASVSATVTGFTPGLTYASLTATASSASVALPGGTTVAFQNTGTTTVSCTLGVGSATAVAGQIQVPASSTVFITPGSNTFGACIDETGSASNVVRIAGGSGLGTGFGGGGGGGGGSSAITTWAGGTLGAMANYGTSPGAVLVPGFNAFITNVPAVSQSGTWNIGTVTTLPALPSNQSVNEAQINGVTPLMGNGATGTGSQRVTIASDNTAFAVNAASTLAAETTKVIGTVRNLGNAGAIFDAAGQNVAAPANWLQSGCQFQTTPTTITATNGSPCQMDNAGNILVNVKTATGLAQGSTTSGQTGSMMMGAVTTAAPTNTTGQTAYASLATTGGLRIAGDGTKLLVTPDSVALPANQSVNVAQFGGVSTATGQVAVSVAPVTATNTALVTALRPDSPGIVALGQTTKSASVPVTVASDQLGANTAANSLPITVGPALLGSYCMGANTGTMAAGLAAGSPIYSFRYGGANLAIVRKVVAEADNITTAFVAGAGKLDMLAARSFSASDTGGTAATLTGNNGKLRTSFATTAISDLRISSTATLTAGTRTLDAQPLASVEFAVPTSIDADLLPSTEIFKSVIGESPLVLANNEGFVIQATVPGTGTWVASVRVCWDEVSAF